MTQDHEDIENTIIRLYTETSLQVRLSEEQLTIIRKLILEDSILILKKISDHKKISLNILLLFYRSILKNFCFGTNLDSKKLLKRIAADFMEAFVSSLPCDLFRINSHGHCNDKCSHNLNLTDNRSCDVYCPSCSKIIEVKTTQGPAMKEGWTSGYIKFGNKNSMLERVKQNLGNQPNFYLVIMSLAQGLFLHMPMTTNRICETDEKGTNKLYYSRNKITKLKLSEKNIQSLKRLVELYKKIIIFFCAKTNVRRFIPKLMIIKTLDRIFNVIKTNNGPANN